MLAPEQLLATWKASYYVGRVRVHGTGVACRMYVAAVCSVGADSDAVVAVPSRVGVLLTLPAGCCLQCSRSLSAASRSATLKRCGG